MSPVSGYDVMPGVCNHLVPQVKTSIVCWGSPWLGRIAASLPAESLASSLSQDKPPAPPPLRSQEMKAQHWKA